MRSIALALPLLVAATSAPQAMIVPTADQRLEQATAEARQARARLDQLEREADKAGDEAGRLRARQAAAAAAIDEAEARISATDARLRQAAARAALTEQRLARRRAPVASLLAGLVTMGRQPPILALADRGSVREMVRVKALLDATMPVIERRTAALEAELAAREALASEASAARAQLVADRRQLTERRSRFARLEAEATERAARLAGEAFGAGDRLLASSEAVALAGNEAAERRAANAAAARLTGLPFAPPRPMRGDSALPPSGFDYSLPIEAPLIAGLGSVSRAGIASRGLKFSSGRGDAVIAPADGTIIFAAPYRGEDGIIIIDHGDGWTSLLLGIASARPKGTRVTRGEFLGRALGPLGVELRRHGVPVSPALIAASSVPLSNGGDRR